MHHLAADADLARIRPVGAGDDLDQRRLAGPVGADQPEHLALTEGEAHVLERLGRAEAAADPGEFDEAQGHVTPRLSRVISSTGA